MPSQTWRGKLISPARYTTSRISQDRRPTIFRHSMRKSVTKTYPPCLTAIETCNPLHLRFFITIQIQRKFPLALIQILIKWSPQNFAHAMTAVLSWHVQKFVVIWWSEIVHQWHQFFSKFESSAKIVSEMGPWPGFSISQPIPRLTFSRVWVHFPLDLNIVNDMFIQQHMNTCCAARQELQTVSQILLTSQFVTVSMKVTVTGKSAWK